MTVRQLYFPKDYRITFNKGYDDDLVPDMSSIIIEYDSLVTLPESTYSRKGYIFRGWKLTLDGDIAYSDGASFIMQYQNATLFADWLPITYDIEYHLFGGETTNITKYTIETETTPLNEAYKENYKFDTWYYRVVENGLEEVSTVSKSSSLMRLGSFSVNSMFTLLSSEDSETLPDDVLPITEIPQGTTGNLELYATYIYDGYIKLIDDPGVIYLGTAEVASNSAVITNINNLREYSGSEENPIYLFNVYLGQTIGELRTIFINEDLVFQNNQGQELTDDKLVSTGMKILLLSNGEVKDMITVILKGDLNGDGVLSMLDLNGLSNHIYGMKTLNEVGLLASKINADGLINMLDLNGLNNHIYGFSQIIWEK